jgi:hypothetical protein
MADIETALGVSERDVDWAERLPKKLGSPSAVYRMALDTRGMHRFLEKQHEDGKPPPLRVQRIIGGAAAAWNKLKGGALALLAGQCWLASTTLGWGSTCASSFCSQGHFAI